MPPKVDRTPGGIPIIPDKVADKIKAGKQDWAIEEVLGEAAVESMVAENALRDEPLHRETLTPISKAEAAQRVTFDGEHLPKAPQTRRVIPAPFRRERIEIRVPGDPVKTWQNVKASDLLAGDIIAGMGVVTDVSHRILRQDIEGLDVAVGDVIVVMAGEDNIGEYGPEQHVRVFRY